MRLHSYTGLIGEPFATSLDSSKGTPSHAAGSARARSAKENGTKRRPTVTYANPGHHSLVIATSRQNSRQGECHARLAQTWPSGAAWPDRPPAYRYERDDGSCASSRRRDR